MLVWLLKLILLSLNIRASHKALAPVSIKRDRTGARSGSAGSSSRGERARKRQIREEVVNWTVLTLFVTAEKLADRTIGRVLPLYATAKLVILLLLLVLRGPGSQQIYDKLVQPIIRPYERPLDLVGFVVNEVLDILLAALFFFPKWAARKIKVRQSRQDVPAILRGLRQPHHPKLAASLADSIERSQGDTNAISARFSQPVHVRLQPIPFKPRRAAPPVRSSSSTHTRATQSSVSSHDPHFLPPPAASTAPFRPVPVIQDAPVPRVAEQQEPVTSKTLLHSGSESGYIGRQPVASIYPSLADVSTPLSTPSIATRPSSKASASNTRGRSAIEAAHESPRGARVKRRPSSPRRAEQESTTVETLPSMSSPPPSPGPISTGPPPTPAPPGAFSFPFPRKPTIPVQADGPDEGSPGFHDVVEMEAGGDGPPRRRSARHSTATPRAENLVAALSSRTRVFSGPSSTLVDAVELKSLRGSSRRKRSPASSGATTPERPAKRSAQDHQQPAGTPRQRALGAIAQLSKDLLSDDLDPEEQTLGLGGRKRAGKGVLGRGTRAAASNPVRRTARGRPRAVSDAAEDSDHGDLAGSAKVATVARKVSPRKRKASEDADTDRDGASRSPPRPVQKSGTTRRQAGSKGTSGIPKPALSTARSTVSTVPDKLPTHVQEATTSTTKSSLPTSRTRRITAESTSASVAPPRRARRVLLGRAGPGAAEEEEEIDGVPVVARRRKQAL